MTLDRVDQSLKVFQFPGHEDRQLMGSVQTEMEAGQFLLAHVQPADEGQIEPVFIQETAGKLVVILEGAVVGHRAKRVDGPISTV